MHRSRILLGLTASVVVLAACDQPITQPDGAPDLGVVEAPRKADFTLTILHSNDGESDLLPGETFGGIGRFARTVADLRTEATEDCDVDCGVILLSSGDNFLAGPEFSASLEKGVPYFDSQALSRIDFDASAIGNHEFDFGPDVLANFIEGFDTNPTPFLSANLDVSGEAALAALESRGLIAKSVIVDVPVVEGDGDDDYDRGRKGKRGGDDDDDEDEDDDDEEGTIRVGVIGATTPELRTISSPRRVEVLQNVARSIQAEVRALRRRGVNKVVLISHLQSVDSDLELISMLRGVDVVVAGGGDELLANDDDRLIPDSDGSRPTPFGPYPLVATDRANKVVPVITTSGSYEYVGRLEVHFKKNGRVLAYAGGPVRVEGPADAAIVAEIEAPVAAAVADLQATVVGTTEVELDGTRSLVRTQETNMGDLTADALLWQANELATSFGVPVADIGIQNGGGIRNSVVLGAGSDITEFDTFQILPFPNFVTIVPDISRDQLKQILERAVSAVEFTSGRFAQIAGASFTWDPAGTPQQQDEFGNITAPGSRIVDVTLDDGTPLVVGGVVQTGAPVAVATIDFLARGGDGYPYMGAPFTSIGVTYQQALRNYIQEALGGTVTGADYPAGGEGRITRLGS